MNIISYGNKTRSRHKYKTFVLADDQSTNLDVTSFSSSSSSSAALYSQQQQTHSRSVLNRRQPPSYTYFLNVLIESEDDEGVYQCINPDLPNFILRNVTVLFESKNILFFVVENII